MDWIYSIQLLFLFAAIFYGYRYSRSPFRMVAYAVIAQAAYGLLLYMLYYKLSIFNFLDVGLKLEKEFWLPNLIKWLGAKMGREIHWKFDQTFATLSMTGGFFLQFLLVMAGNLLRQAVRQTRLDYVQAR